MSKEKVLVGIIMGSASDLPVMQAAADIFQDFITERMSVFVIKFFETVQIHKDNRKDFVFCFGLLE